MTKPAKPIVILLVITIVLFAPKSVNAALQNVISSNVIGDLKNPTRQAAGQALFGRDGGVSVKLGDKILWLFGDTFWNPPSEDGVQYRTNTAATAPASDPYNLSEPLDSTGAPYQFIPFNPTQQAYNNAATNKSHDRYIIWPDRTINISPNSAYIFYKNLKSTPKSGGGTLSPVGIGVAQVNAGTTITPTIVNEALFSTNETQFVPELTHGDYVYAFNCIPGFLVGDCAVARAPKTQLINRSAYQFWDGSTWQSDINQISRDIEGSTNSMSIIYSEYLNKYVMLAAVSFGTKLYIKTADEPQGPWSEREVVYDYGSALSGGRMHPELSRNDDQILPITHSYSSSSQKIVELTFNPKAKGIDPIPEDPQTDDNNSQQNPTNQDSQSETNSPDSNSSPQIPKTGKIVGSFMVAISILATVFIAVKEHRLKKAHQAHSGK